MSEFEMARYVITLRAPLDWTDTRTEEALDKLKEMNIPDQVDDFLRGLELPAGLSINVNTKQ